MSAARKASSKAAGSGSAPPARAAAAAAVVVERPAWAAADPVMRAYFDDEWGVPVRDERGLFEALSLEVFQAGLAWSTILRKRPAFRSAFAGFDPGAVALFDEARVAALLQDVGIVRNRRKVEATVVNARATLALRNEGGLERLVWSFEEELAAAAGAPAAAASPQAAALARALRAKGFAFVGPTTMHAFMQAVGVIDAHPLGRAR